MPVRFTDPLPDQIGKDLAARAAVEVLKEPMRPTGIRRQIDQADLLASVDAEADSLHVLRQANFSTGEKERPPGEAGPCPALWTAAAFARTIGEQIGGAGGFSWVNLFEFV